LRYGEMDEEMERWIKERWMKREMDEERDG
jgi:hypothetical protein